MFGPPKRTTGGLFSNTTANTGASTGTPGGGLFGSTATSQTATPTFGSTNTGGGLFGSQTNPATSSSSLFGPQSTGTTSSLFGSNTPKTGGLFGNTSTTSTAGTTGGGLFGTPKPATGSLFANTTSNAGGFGSKPGGSLFGPTTTSTMQNPSSGGGADEKSLQEIIANTTAIQSAIGEPKLYGDDSDASITRLNQLLAATGIGSGFYDKDKPAVVFDHFNPYFQFRAVGYCALSRHRDSDGIVALILNQSADKFSTQQEKQKLLDDLYKFFGENPQVHAHLVSIRPLTNDVCEAEIYVTESEVGRISAKKVYQVFEQNVKALNDKRQIYEQMKCQAVVPRVEMTQEDIKRYLSHPPKGFTENEWRSAILHNPDPQNLLPYPIYGYKELAERRQKQVTEGEVQRKTFAQLNERLKTATKDIQEINNLKKIFQEDAKRLRHRILRIIAVNHNNSHQSVVSMEEEKLLSRLETISVCMNAPNRLRQRCDDLRTFMTSNKETLEARKHEAADHQYLSAEESANLKRYLSRRQQDLELISDSLKKDADDIQVMVDQAV